MIAGTTGHGILLIPFTIRFMITGIHGTGIPLTTIRRFTTTTRMDTATDMVDFPGTDMAAATMADTVDMASMRTLATTRRTTILAVTTTMVALTGHEAAQPGAVVIWPPTLGVHVQLQQPAVAVPLAVQ